MRKREAWWRCSDCNKLIARVKSGKFHEVIMEHRKMCSPTAGGRMVQVEQGKR